MKIFLYVVVLATLMTFLPRYLHPPILVLNGLIASFYIIKQSTNRRKAILLTALLMILTIVIVYSGFILHFFVPDP